MVDSAWRGTSGVLFLKIKRFPRCILKGTLMGSPNREPQEYSRNKTEHKDPGRYIPIMFLLYSWGSLSGVPIKVPFNGTLATATSKASGVRARGIRA